jgi:hypothetical protein
MTLSFEYVLSILLTCLGVLVFRYIKKNDDRLQDLEKEIALIKQGYASKANINDGINNLEKQFDIKFDSLKNTINIYHAKLTEKIDDNYKFLESQFSPKK